MNVCAAEIHIGIKQGLTPPGGAAGEIKNKTHMFTVFETVRDWEFRFIPVEMCIPQVHTNTRSHGVSIKNGNAHTPPHTVRDRQ